MEISDFQRHIDRMYSDKDRARGASATFLWLAEEIGELASAIADGNRAQKQEEFADVHIRVCQQSRRTDSNCKPGALQQVR